MLFLRASNSVVDACPKLVKVGSASRNLLVESELGLLWRKLTQVNRVFSDIVYFTNCFYSNLYFSRSFRPSVFSDI
jgi:hypothetical protein